MHEGAYLWRTSRTPALELRVDSPLDISRRRRCRSLCRPSPASIPTILALHKQVPVCRVFALAVIDYPLPDIVNGGFEEAGRAGGMAVN